VPGDPTLLQLLAGVLPEDYFGYGKKPPPRVGSPVGSQVGFGYQDPNATQNGAAGEDSAPPAWRQFLPSNRMLERIYQTGKGAITEGLAPSWQAAHDFAHEPNLPPEYKQRLIDETMGPMKGMGSLGDATFQTGKNIVTEGLATAGRWLNATHQLPGAKATDDLVIPEGGSLEDAQINPNRIEPHDVLAPLGLAGMGSVVVRPGVATGVSLADHAMAKYHTFRDRNLPGAESIIGEGANRVLGDVPPEHRTLFGGDFDANWAITDAAHPAPSTGRLTPSNEGGRPIDRFRLLADQQRSSLPGMIANGIKESAETAVNPEKVTPASTFLDRMRAKIGEMQQGGASKSELRDAMFDMRREEFTRLWNSGTPDKEISDALGLNYQQGRAKRMFGDGLPERASRWTRDRFWDENHQAFAEMYRSGAPREEIGNRFGISASRVSAKARELELPARTARNEDELIDQVHAMRMDGQAYSDIARELGITRNKAIGIGYRLRQSGVHILADQQRSSLPGLLANSTERRGDYLGGAANASSSLNKKELYARQGMPVPGDANNQNSQ
jgi:hypothetical protein